MSCRHAETCHPLNLEIRDKELLERRHSRLSDRAEHLLTVVEDLLKALQDSGRAIKLRQEAAAAASEVGECISRPYTAEELAALRPGMKEIEGVFAGSCGFCGFVFRARIVDRASFVGKRRGVACPRCGYINGDPEDVAGDETAPHVDTSSGFEGEALVAIGGGF